MAAAYFRAAGELYASLEHRELTPLGKLDADMDIWDSEDLVYGFVTLGRHAAELLLKMIILCRRRLDPTIDFVDGHDLERLRTSANAIFTEMPACASTERQAELDRLVDLLIKYDSTGMDYRYPADRRMDSLNGSVTGEMLGFPGLFGGQPFLAVPFLDLTELAKLLRNVSALVHIADITEEHLRAEAEMRADYGG